MLERAGVKSQLDSIQNSILMIDMHRSTIEGTALNVSVFGTLKASGDVLRQMGVTGQGLRSVEDVVAGLEESMKHASEITTMLSTGSVSGTVNSMGGMYGTDVDEKELMKELDELLLEDEGGTKIEGGVLPEAAAAASPAPVLADADQRKTQKKAAQNGTDEDHDEIATDAAAAAAQTRHRRLAVAE